MTKKRAGIYGRNSKGDAKSIEDQLALGRRAVRQEADWTLSGEYSDDSSASRYRTQDRDAWGALLADLAGGKLDLLVLWKPNRGSRDEIDWLLMLRACRERGVLIHVLADRRTYDPRISRDWKTLAEDGISAAYYSEELAENVRRGIRDTAEAGGPHGAVAYGYARIYVPDPDRPRGRPDQEPSDRAPIIKEIFERLDKRVGISTIMKDFRRRGVPTASGALWRTTTIRHIATNPTYIGKRVHLGRLSDATWPVIVDEDVFWRVQELLGDPERRIARPSAAKWLLGGLIATPCDTAQRVPGRRPESPDRYACRADGCLAVSRPDADDVVTEAILARLKRPDAKRFLARADDKVRAAQAEATKYRTDLEAARQSFERPDGISAEALARKERALAPLIEDAVRRSRPAGIGGLLQDLVDADDPARVWNGLELSSQRALVSGLVVLRLGPASRRLRRSERGESRLAEARFRLGDSTWVGDETPWRDLGAI